MTEQGSEFGERWIVVSGASSGIGRAVAVDLAKRGARVVLMGRRAEELEATSKLCGGSSRAEIVAIDLSHTDEIALAVAAVVKKIGRVYGFCHSAGVVQTLPLSAMTSERLRSMMDVNFLAGLELARAITRRDSMDTAGGSLLWIASVYAHVGAPGQVGYCATKGAITAAIRSMALELAPRKIRVNSLSPGFVRTPMTDASGSRMSEEQWARIVDMHPLGTGAPEDVARAAAFMLHPSNTWVTGADLIIDGGYTLH
jgi:NAD(P)-dependent dehydrogenase (short-subunit alcohol dehydrogenase family)